MTAGLPGIGIGGMFYLLLVLLMPLYELVPTLRGQSSLPRWRSIARHWILAAAILAGLGGAAAGLRMLFERLQRLGLQPQPWNKQLIDVTTVSPSAALYVAFAVLMLVLLAMYLLRLWVGARGPRQ